MQDTATGPKKDGKNTYPVMLADHDQGGDTGMGQVKYPKNRTHAGHDTADQDAAGLGGAELEKAQEEYRRLAASIAELGLIHHGSIVHRFAQPDTEESGEATKSRGRKSYYQWTSKVAGKTISRTLTPEEAALYREWIDNDRELRSILKQMRRVSEHAANLILNQKVK